MRAVPRLFVACLSAEINTFVESPTTIADFADKLLARGDVNSLPDGYATTPSKIWARSAKARGWSVVSGIHANARPGGRLTAEAYRALRDELLNQLLSSGGADVVILSLHGSMAADGVDDCEGDLLARIRGVVGREAKIGVQLDSHCHLTRAMMDNATAMVMYKTYPHVDYRERAQELWRLIEDAFDNRTAPVMAAARCPVLGLFPTSRPASEPPGPMPAFVAEMAGLEGKGSVLSVSLSGGFPWADLPITGAAVLVVADADATAAESLAGDLARRFLAMADDAALQFLPLDNALDRAEAASAHPVLLSDASDQTGGGAPGDSTFMLAAILDRGMHDVCLGPLWDPAAVDACYRAGVGAQIPLRVGGKGSQRYSGGPLDLDATVVGVYPDSHQSGLNGEDFAVGDIAVAAVDGVHLVLSRHRTSVYSPSLFTNHGVDLRRQRHIVVKNLYRHSFLFAQICPRMLLVAAPGACCADWATLHYTRLARPMWPLDADSASTLSPTAL